ncbi:serine/threonine protein kinase [Pseudenhygromyxa sp. WMMC2535]|uniref:serine/threonine-protein kinase n=1 Tax=Pseudenhygromyxa sp. WMMC2535 TaxID=2712867 RepID=UPI001552A2E8|nr:serine/threonine-protein kinase [Pseudenhygromyxa sp. WMMC2535]NVB41778.1 serine/threonine protein kinase [Pseudenhygromyxa sp. WMMC2535]
MNVRHETHLETISSKPIAPGEANADAPSTQASGVHPGAGGLKARIRDFLFGGAGPRRVGRFVIQHPLGSGGMGTVYLAEDEELGRLVALKLVRYDRISTAAQARLRREAKALAKLAHPNVVQVFEVGEHEGLLFVAMEYIEGQSLRAWLDAEPRAWEAIVAVFEQAAQGLAAAHAAGLVHRDFKPDNVIVGKDGRVRVVDFGLVATGSEDDRVAALSAQGDAPLTEVALTETGEIMGTPAYMAPEQFLGETPTPASDQFSFFVALYEALARERPFNGATVEQTMRAVLDGDSRELRVRGLPGGLRSAISQGIARDPKARFPDMQAVLGELGELRRPGRARRRVRIIGAAAASMLIVLGGMLLMKDEGGGDPGEGEGEGEGVAAPAPEDDEAGDTLEAAREQLAKLIAAEDDTARLAIAEAYLSEFEDSGGVSRRLIAEASVGAVLWRRSCPEATDGLCLSIERASESGEGSGEGSGAAPQIAVSCATATLYTERPRDANAEQAIEHLRLATQLAATASPLESAAEQEALAAAIGEAKTLLADAQLEDYLALRGPRGLDFAESPGRTALSKDAFAAFFRQKLEKAQAITAAYEAVKTSGSPRWIALASARSALTYRGFSDALLGLPLSESQTTDKQRDAYCEALETQTAPMLERAEEALDYCRAKVEDAALDPALCELPGAY